MKSLLLSPFYYPTKKELKLMKTKKGRKLLLKLEKNGQSINCGPK